jgi:dTDP-4-amino-4,6-dideoxygalactose transaminase
VTAILVAAGACADALDLVPLLRACEGRIAARIAWFGGDDELAAAVELGLPPAAERRAPVAADSAARVAEAVQFAAAVLARSAFRAVVTRCHSTAARAFALAANAVGVPVLRLSAGLRTHDAACPVERDRRLADHAAAFWLAPTDFQRNELVREGLPAERMAVAGSLLPAFLRELPPPPASGAPYAWLALEHAGSVADRDDLAALLANTAAAARACGLRVLAADTALGPALRRHDLALPPDVQLAPVRSARAQLDALRTAGAVLTDSAGHQELACVAGVPCVLLRETTARPETVAVGACQLAGPTGRDLPRTLAVALRQARAWSSPYSDAAPLAVAAIEAVVRPPAVAADTRGPFGRPDLALPNDGDATGRTLGDEEIQLVAAALRSGTLNSTKGTFVTAFERRFAAWLGRRHAIACASGTAAVHCAIAALGLQAGDEVITTPITDMGAITPILYEGCVPVFADVDPRTLNVTAATIRARLTARTRAIVATHLFGLPCELGAIFALARERGIHVIEDAAQAFGATCAGRRIGTFGALAAFSLQQGKHITTGEGGIVATDDDALARRVFLAVNKAWGYGDKAPDHYFPALNWRLTELQGATALAQLPKLDWVVARRRDVAAALRKRLAGVRGLDLPGDPPHGEHSYWKFAFLVDPDAIPGGGVALGARMQAAGVRAMPRYIQKPAFECALFADWSHSPVTRAPLHDSPRRGGPMPLFDRREYPGAVQALERVVVLPINERYTGAHVERIAAVIRGAVEELSRG